MPARGDRDRFGQPAQPSHAERAEHEAELRARDDSAGCQRRELPLRLKLPHYRGCVERRFADALEGERKRQNRNIA
jgi:hypothetical protein